MKIEITIETIQTETIVQLQSFEPAPENLGGGGIGRILLPFLDWNRMCQSVIFGSLTLS